MSEILILSRATLGIYGVCPLRITAASIESNEVVATSIILAKFPNGEFKALHRTERLAGTMSDPLPEYDWTETMADSAAETVTTDFFMALAEIKDPIWNEYLRIRGPMSWTDLEGPERELVRYAIHADKPALDKLSWFGSRLSQPKARAVFQKAVELALKVRLRDS